MSTPRPVDVGRLGLGVVALARPDLLLRLSDAHDQRARGAVRVLGARYVVQSAGGMAVDRPWVQGADAAVDLVHAATMLVLAAVLPAHRRLALTSAAVATGFAVADLKEKMR